MGSGSSPGDRHLSEQSLTAEQLHKFGLANLRTFASEHGVEVHPLDAHFAVIAGGNFEASLLLVDDLWEDSFRQFVSGAYVAAVPARDVLAFAAATSGAGGCIYAR